MEQLLIEQWGYPSGHLTESSEYITSLVEAKQDGKGGLWIEGVFMQAEMVNRNGRLYPKSVLEKSVAKYIQEQVSCGQALGELNHPSRPFVDPLHAAILIEKLWWEGNNVMGRARIIEGDGAEGDKTAALIRAGWIPGVSSRGLGVLKEKSGYNEVQDGFKLTVGVDVVWGPSAPNAYVKAVMESTTNPVGAETSTIIDSPEAKHDDDVFSALTECFKNLV